jgi:hypothetical protein
MIYDIEGMRCSINNLIYMSEKYESDHLLDSSLINLETLMSLSSSFVYALVNDSRKMVQVYGSVNMLVHLGHLLEEIRASGEYSTMLEDIQNLKIVLLETNVPSKDIKLTISNWISKYKDSGWILYKDISPMRLVLETRLEYRAGRLHYFLYAVGQGKYRLLLGVFEKKKDLKSFCHANYPGDRISHVVVHESAST